MNDTKTSFGGLLEIYPEIPEILLHLDAFGNISSNSTRISEGTPRWTLGEIIRGMPDRIVGTNSWRTLCWNFWRSYWINFRRNLETNSSRNLCRNSWRNLWRIYWRIFEIIPGRISRITPETILEANLRRKSRWIPRGIVVEFFGTDGRINPG